MWLAFGCFVVPRDDKTSGTFVLDAASDGLTSTSMSVRSRSDLCHLPSSTARFVEGSSPKWCQMFWRVEMFTMAMSSPR